MNAIQLQTRNNTPVVESLVVADGLGVQHKNLLETIGKYQPQIESSFGAIAFETRLPQNGGHPLRVAYLNEGQFMFIGTLSRNTPEVVDFKATLVKKFQEAKSLAQQLTAPKSPSEIIAEGFALALKEAEQAKQQLQLAETTIKQQAPMVSYYNEVLQTEGGQVASVIAQDFGMAAVTFNRKLKEQGVIRKVGGAWVLCARHQGKGYTITRTHTYLDTKGEKQTSVQMLWTQKGREFLHRLLHVA